MAYKILCVDDEDQILAVFQQAFENTDYEVYTARNGIDALVAVREHHPDLVFLDEMMPAMRGTETLALIHEIDPTIAVIIVSGYVVEREAKELLAKGAYDFFQKPIDLTHLLDVVEQWRFAKEVS